MPGQPLNSVIPLPKQWNKRVRIPSTSTPPISRQSVSHRGQLGQLHSPLEDMLIFAYAGKGRGSQLLKGTRSATAAWGSSCVN